MQSFPLVASVVAVLSAVSPQQAFGRACCRCRAAPGACCGAPGPELRRWALFALPCRMSGWQSIIEFSLTRLQALPALHSGRACGCCSSGPDLQQPAEFIESLCSALPVLLTQAGSVADSRLRLRVALWPGCPGRDGRRALRSLTVVWPTACCAGGLRVLWRLLSRHEGRTAPFRPEGRFLHRPVLSGRSVSFQRVFSPAGGRAGRRVRRVVSFRNTKGHTAAFRPVAECWVSAC